MPMFHRGSLRCALLGPVAAVALGALVGPATAQDGAKPPAAPETPPDAPRPTLVIYDEATGVKSKPFQPSGFMPDGNGISYRPDWETSPHSGATCIKIRFQMSETAPWRGLYFLAGGGWGTSPGVDVYQKLGIARGTAVRLRFWIRADERVSVECKIGGVDRGPHPDTIPFALTTGYFDVGTTWTEKTLEVKGDVSGLVGGFCVVSSKDNNPDVDSIAFYLDDIRLDGPPATTTAAPVTTSIASRLREYRWIAYSPTKYDPSTKPVTAASEDSIRDDLRAVRTRSFDGLVTYGCKDGLEKVPQIAKEVGFRAVIQGVWDPADETERTNVVVLAQAGLIHAVCCGNEGLGSRYQWTQLAPAIERLRAETRLPVTTTEQVEDYGDSELVDRVDFVFPNVHPVWHSMMSTASGVPWLKRQCERLKKLVGDKPLLVKETGLPSGGGRDFSDEGQKEFWMKAEEVSKETDVPVVVFEAFDCAWKHEKLPAEAGDIGMSWGIWRTDRSPKPAASVFPKREDR